MWRSEWMGGKLEVSINLLFLRRVAVASRSPKFFEFLLNFLFSNETWERVSSRSFVSPSFNLWSSVITDKSSSSYCNISRYEPPVDFPRSTQASSEVLSLTTSNSNDLFSFAVVRQSSNRKIFDTSIGGLIFSDQFIQIATYLPSENMYGWGENTHQSLRVSGGTEAWTVAWSLPLSLNFPARLHEVPDLGYVCPWPTSRFRFPGHPEPLRSPPVLHDPWTRWQGSRSSDRQLQCSGSDDSSRTIPDLPYHRRQPRHVLLPGTDSRSSDSTVPPVYRKTVLAGLLGSGISVVKIWIQRIGRDEDKDSGR